MNFAKFVHSGPRVAGTVDSPQEEELFELMHSLKINDTIPFSMYKSVRTGLTVCIADVEGPIINCHFGLATEVLKDEGLPEAVAYILLKGSEEYPYTNLLDRWSYKCFSLGTEIHTFQDYTCYSMKTCGSEGFLSLLPVYLDHILYPTLKEAAYIIDIHHITKYGDNAGTLYLNTRNKELDGEHVTYIELMKAMYPENCGYSSIIQGTSSYISQYLSLDDIRWYHNKFYRSDNLTVLIVGQVQHDKVLQVLRSLEQKIISKGDRGAFMKPWQIPIKPLTKSVDVEFQYPCFSNAGGVYVRIAWQGPSTVNKLYDYLGFCLLSQYLTDTSDSVLQKEFVKEQICYKCYLHEFSTSALSLMFPDVPSHKVALIEESVMKVLKHVLEVGIELNEMKTVIHRYIIKVLSDLENNLHNIIANGLFKHMLYGKTNKDLDYRLNIIHYLKKLENEPKCYWSNLYKKYFVDTPMVIVRGIPSRGMLRIFLEEEKDAKIDRIRELGMLGLARNDILFYQAISENSYIPNEVLESIPVPGIDSIDFHHIKSYNTETSEQHPELDVTQLPLFTHLEHADTNFIYMFVVIDTNSVSKKYKKYIPLLLELIMESPVKRVDQLIPYGDIIDELKADTVMAATRISIYKPTGFTYNSSSVYLMLQLEYEKYEKGIKWIKELLYDTVLTVDRLEAVTIKKINEIAQLKEKGDKVIDDLMKILLYNEDSNPFLFSLFQQEEFLTDIIERLKNNEDQKEIMTDVESSKKTLTLLKNIELYMILNVTKLTKEISDVYSPWKIFLSDAVTEKKTKFNVTADWTLMTLTNHVAINGYIIGLENKTNMFFLQSYPCINDYRNPDLPALLVCLMYLDQMDGPLSILIRHSERARDFEFFVSLHEGMLYLAINDATDLIGAYIKTKINVENRVSGHWDDNFCESAKSLMIFQIIRMKNAVGNRANESLRCCRGMPLDYCLPLIQHISAVTKDDMNRVGNQYIMPLFDPEVCKTIIACHTSKILDINETFKT